MPSKDHLFDFSTETDVPVGPSGLASDLLKEILEKRAAVIVRMISGTCKTMESYAEAVGYVRAMDFVLGYPDRKKHEIEASLGVAIDEDT